MKRLIKALARALGVKREYAVIALLLDAVGDYQLSRHLVGATPWLSYDGFMGLGKWVANATGVSPDRVLILSVCEVRR